MKNDVEIAREDHELPGAAHFADLRDDQFGALLARFPVVVRLEF